MASVNSIPVSLVIEIMRNTTGRVDPFDPNYDDAKMLQYLNVFLQTAHPSESRIFYNRTWYDFTFTVDPNDATKFSDEYDIGLDDLGFTTIEPPAYVSADAKGGTDDKPGFEIFWYQDPTQFYRIWPDTQDYQPSRPTYVLYYNNKLLFRNPPDKAYNVKIAAYNIEIALSLALVEGQPPNLPNAYYARYLAYGASLDIFSDAGEMDRYAECMRVYKKYRGNVLARTWNQLNNQRATPMF